MATNYPTSTQWITFPVELKDVKKIEWSEKRSSKSATYFTCKCYWGDIKTPVSEENKSKPRAETEGWKTLEIKGQTQLFIASEFVEASLRGGPLKEFHVKDLAKFNATESDNKKNGWATMQLNSFFHYGQSGWRGRYKRWIVYHPPISSSFSSPKPFQHRFTGLLSADIIDAVADTLPDAASLHSKTAKKVAKLGVPIMKMGVEGLKNVFGHHLHQYLNVEEVQRVKEAVAKKTKDSKPADVLSSKEVLAIQAKEDEIAEAENKATDESAIERAYENLDQLQTSLEEVSQRNDLIQRFVFMTTPSDGLTFEGLVENLVEIENSKLLEPGKDDMVSVDPQGGSKDQGPREEFAGNETKMPLESQAPASDPKDQRRHPQRTLIRPPVRSDERLRNLKFKSKAVQQYFGAEPPAGQFPEISNRSSKKVLPRDPDHRNIAALVSPGRKNYPQDGRHKIYDSCIASERESGN